MNKMKIIIKRDKDGRWKSFEFKKTIPLENKLSDVYTTSRVAHDVVVDLIAAFNGERINNDFPKSASMKNVW